MLLRLLLMFARSWSRDVGWRSIHRRSISLRWRSRRSRRNFRCSRVGEGGDVTGTWAGASIGASTGAAEGVISIAGAMAGAKDLGLWRDVEGEFIGAVAGDWPPTSPMKTMQTNVTVKRVLWSIIWNKLIETRHSRKSDCEWRLKISASSVYYLYIGHRRNMERSGPLIEYKATYGD